jgi:hypothetical protein
MTTTAMTTTAMTTTAIPSAAIPSDAGTATHQRRLFDLNAACPTAAVSAAIEDLEASWVVPLAEQAYGSGPAPHDPAALFADLDALLVPDDEVVTGARYLAATCPRKVFRALIGELAAFGLTEAQPFLPIVARLPPEARMPMVRVLIDELGAGDLSCSHSYLFLELLRELDLSDRLEDHLDGTSDEVFSFINLFHWLAARAPCPEYFLGGLAHLVASITDGFTAHLGACERLGVVHDRYFREHIGAPHRGELRAAIACLDRIRPLDHMAVRVGARLVAEASDRALLASLRRAHSAP